MTLRKIIVSLAATAALGALAAAAVVFRPYLPTSCTAARRLDRVLGGGPPVCLGRDAAQLERYTNQNRDSLSCALVQRNARGEYLYLAQHAGPRCRLSGPVVTACFSPLEAATAAPLARAATARLGGSWRFALVQTPPGIVQQLWTSDDGLQVSHTISFDGSRTVCVKDTNHRF